MTVEIVCAGIGSYFIGSIPVGVLVARAQGIDILSVGSGSIGATNVYRTLGSKAGFFVFVLDVIKGLLPAILASYYFLDHTTAFGIGLMSIIGHTFSPWLKFKGGKGIATGLGVLLGTIPFVAVSALAGFLITVAFTRYISAGSLVAAVLLAPLGFVFRQPPIVIAILALVGVFIIFKHRANFSRLRAGTEPKFTWKGGSSGESSVPENIAKSEPSDTEDRQATETSKEKISLD